MHMRAYDWPGSVRYSCIEIGSREREREQWEGKRNSNNEVNIH